MPIKDKVKFAAYMKQWRANNKTKERAAVNARRKKNRAAIKEVVKAAKNCPCADCRCCYPAYVMDFDHKKDKKFNIAMAVKHNVSLTVLLAEIAKCDVVCANCHRIRTFSSVVEQ